MCKLNNRSWVDDMTKELLEVFIEEGQLLYFQFNKKDYLIERFSEGFMIADPIPYYENGGYPDNPQFQYPRSFQAKTVDEFIHLPFLEGKTIFEQWENIRFWDY